MPISNIAAGDALTAPFSREVVLYDQTRFLGGEDAVILRGTGIYTPAMMKYSTSTPSQLCDHPIEEGSVVSDHKILQQREFSLTVALPSRMGGGMIKELDYYYRNSGKIIIKCATGIYLNMILTDVPVEISPNNLSRPMYDLSFREVVIVVPQTEQPSPAAEKKPQRSADLDTLRRAVNPNDFGLFPPSKVVIPPGVI